MQEAEVLHNHPVVNKKPKLTPKERKFVNAKVKGLSQREAYKQAYNVQPTTKIHTIDRNASKVASRDRVTLAIEQALDANELTPEHAIKELKKIVDQDENPGAKRLAIKDVLELHGYKAVTPKMSFNIDKGFFSSSRGSEND